jgi:hypothetical protein
MPDSNNTLRFVRRSVLVILAIGLVGTEIELVLLRHTEDAWQWVPIVLIALALAILVWYVAGGGRAAVLALRAAMVACVISGAVGVFLHFRGNIDYARDSNPSLSGRALYWEAIRGTTPALAPGTMVQLGLLGLVFAFRHPQLTRARGPLTFSQDGKDV